MAIRVQLKDQTVEADTPEELYDFLKLAALATSVALAAGIDLISRTEAAAAPPSVPLLRTLWRKLGTAAQRRLVVTLASFRTGVTADRLIEMLGLSGPKGLAGLLGAVAKNADLVGLEWSRWITQQNGTFSLQPAFLHRLQAALREEKVPLITELDLAPPGEPGPADELTDLELAHREWEEELEPPD